MATSLSPREMIQIYRTMCRIRAFETSVAELFAANRMPGHVHLSTGEEAVATGVCSALRQTDYITSTIAATDTCLQRARSPAA